jgi:hypothetical protein
LTFFPQQCEGVADHDHDLEQRYTVAAKRRTDMRTLIIIVGGLVLLGLFVLAGRWMGGAGTGGMVTAAKVFLPIWLVVVLVNLWLGTRAGYSVAEEIPIQLLIFVVPGAVAGFLWWKFS